MEQKREKKWRKSMKTKGDCLKKPDDFRQTDSMEKTHKLLKSGLKEGTLLPAFKK